MSGEFIAGMFAGVAFMFLVFWAMTFWSIRKQEQYIARQREILARAEAQQVITAEHQQRNQALLDGQEQLVERIEALVGRFENRSRL